MLKGVLQQAFGLAYRGYVALQNPIDRLERFDNNQLFEEFLDDDKYVFIDRLEDLMRKLGENHRYWASEADFKRIVVSLLDEAKRAVHAGKADGYETPGMGYCKRASFIRIGDLKDLALRRIESGELPFDGVENTLDPDNPFLDPSHPMVTHDGIKLNMVRALGIALNLSVQMEGEELFQIGGTRFYNRNTAKPA